MGYEMEKIKIGHGVTIEDIQPSVSININNRNTRCKFVLRRDDKTIKGEYILGDTTYILPNNYINSRTQRDMKKLFPTGYSKSHISRLRIKLEYAITVRCKEWVKENPETIERETRRKKVVSRNQRFKNFLKKKLLDMFDDETHMVEIIDFKSLEKAYEEARKEILVKRVHETT